MQLNMRALGLLLLLCAVCSNTSADDTTPQLVQSVSIEVEPTKRPPVGTDVIVRCKGPLRNGGALVFDGDGKTRRGAPVVSFKMIRADGGAPNIQKQGGEAGRFTIFLDGDREGVKIKFKVKFSDNGYYRCAYFDSDTNSVKMQSGARLIESYYPPGEPQLRFKEKLVNDTFLMVITCKAYVGYPPGNLVLTIDGIDNLDVGKPKKTKAVGKLGNVWTVKAKIPASLDFNGTQAKCIAGGKPQNPLILNATQVLDVQVPVSRAQVRNPGVVFRPPGSRLECGSVGNPPPTYKWTLNHEELNTSKSYIIVPKTTGIYSATCNVSNEVLGKVFSSVDHFHFAVVPEKMPCSNIREEDSAHLAFIIATVLAVIFAIIALIVVVILIVTKRKSGYDKM